MKNILIVWCLTLSVVEIGLAENQTNEIRAFLYASVGEVKGRKENLDTKKDKAEEICDKLIVLQPTKPEDASLLVRFLTIADPREVDAGLKSPSVVFPAVAKLIELGQIGAEAVVDAIQCDQMAKDDQIDKAQTALNIAYVLSHTIGTEQGLALLRAKENREQLSVHQLVTLRKVSRILTERSITKTPKPSE